MRGAIHHLDLTVKDPWGSRAFYAAVLGFMGYREVADHDRGFDYDLATRDGFTSIGIMKASGPKSPMPAPGPAAPQPRCIPASRRCAIS